MHFLYRLFYQKLSGSLKFVKLEIGNKKKIRGSKNHCVFKKSEIHSQQVFSLNDMKFAMPTYFLLQDLAILWSGQLNNARF